MWADIRRLYSDAGAFARALPFLFLIPVLIEFAQHIVEIRIGMYDSRAAARGVSIDDARLSIGFAKTLALLLPGYWFARYMAWDRDAAKARAIERPAALLFAAQFAILGAVQWFALFGPPVTTLLGLDDRSANIATIAIVAAQTIIGIYLTAWLVAWPLGNRAIGPVRSFGVIAGSFWRTAGYVLAGTVPLMAAHYALGIGAIGLPRGVVWVMMTLDAIVVGFLALAMTGANYIAATRAAQRNGVTLRP